jgi:hypothetical protein
MRPLYDARERRAVEALRELVAAQDGLDGIDKAPFPKSYRYSTAWTAAREILEGTATLESDRKGREEPGQVATLIGHALDALGTAKCQVCPGCEAEAAEAVNHLQLALEVVLHPAKEGT